MPADVDEFVVRVADVCTYKWDMLQNRPFAFLVSAFAGGAFVVFGAMLALSVSAGVPGNLAPGLANLMMGLVFMFSLVIIMFGGMTLVTADMALFLSEDVEGNIVIYRDHYCPISTCRVARVGMNSSAFAW